MRVNCFEIRLVISKCEILLLQAADVVSLAEVFGGLVTSVEHRTVQGQTVRLVRSSTARLTQLE